MLENIPLEAFREAGELILVSGTVGTPRDGGTFEDEVESAFADLEAKLAAASSDLGHVVYAFCILADMADFDRFNAVYATKFTVPYPARTTIGAQLVPGYRFEIAVVATKS